MVATIVSIALAADKAAGECRAVLQIHRRLSAVPSSHHLHAELRTPGDSDSAAPSGRRQHPQATTERSL